MNPWLHKMLADAHADDLRRAVTAPRPKRRRRRARSLAPVAAPIEETVTIRYAFADDAQALERLAVLDTQPVPAQPILLAEVDGDLRAALSMADGTVVADPFRRTAFLVELLAARAAQLTASSHRSRHPLAPPVWLSVGD